MFVSLFLVLKEINISFVKRNSVNFHGRIDKIVYFYSKFNQMRSVVVFFMLFFTGGILCSQVEMGNEKSFTTLGNMLGGWSHTDVSSQTIFFAVPAELNEYMYLRVFDPDCGGAYDKPNGFWETNTVFEVYGGKGCISELDARRSLPEGDYKSGTILYRALFARESEVDSTWVSFGPFLPHQGETLEAYPGYAFFKLIVEGRTGNDGNIYALSVSSRPDRNTEIANAEIFEYRRIHYEGDELLVTDYHPEPYDPSVVQLPVTLQPLKQDINISIIAEPIDD